MKVLFISYYFEPFPTVGAKRLTYWARNIGSFNENNEAFNATVVTAMPESEQEHPNLDVYYVPNEGKSLFSSLFKTDKGASWLYNLDLFLRSHLVHHSYDVAIITGGPFLHFFILKLLKKRKIKVFLDFRDPFANNPRGLHASSVMLSIKRFIMRRMEAYFISAADKIITVNEYCVKLLTDSNKFSDKFIIIDNGFDESQLQLTHSKSIPDSGDVKFVYAGTFYKDPIVFLKVIDENFGFKFVHIGAKSRFLNEELSCVLELGSMSYYDAISNMDKCDVCMIFTSGEPFESTTKIFDYIALGKMIWIVTDGDVKTGALHTITCNYPNVIWSKNCRKEIKRVAEKFSQGVVVAPFDKKHLYSRKYGLQNLVKELKKMHTSKYH